MKNEGLSLKQIQNIFLEDESPTLNLSSSLFWEMKKYIIRWLLMQASRFLSKLLNFLLKLRSGALGTRLPTKKFSQNGNQSDT